MSVDNLNISFGQETLFEGISFSLQRGEHVGFIGRNGSGKTTLFRVIMGLEKADNGLIIIPKNYRIGYLDQHIRFTQSTIIEEACLVLDSDQEQYKAEIILLGLGFLEKDFLRSPDEFSGGFQLRLHLAKVLLSEPDCILLDEPTNYLDIVSIRWLKTFLREFSGEFICITHDREFMDAVSTHTMGLHRKKIKKIKGSSLDYFEQLLMAEELYEKTRVNLAKKVAHAQSFIDRFGAKATKAGQAQSRKKLIEKIPVLEKLAQMADLDFKFHESPFPGKKLIKLKDVSFSYHENQPIVKEFSLDIEKGEKIAIIGKNGYGKSTLLRLFAIDLEPSFGIVEPSPNLQIGYFGQTHIAKLSPSLTIEEEIERANPQLATQQIKRICGVMLFSGSQMGKRISVLSGGEKSRVLLGKILAKKCNFLLLDEPTHHLDMESIEALIEAIDEFEGSVLIVTHSEEILKRLPLDKVIYCHKGHQEIFLGNYHEFLEKKGYPDDPLVVESSKENINDRKAELVKLKFATLKEIESDIKKQENRIIRLEEELKKQQKELVKCSEMNGKNLHQLTLQYKKTEEEINQEFIKLEKLHQDYYNQEVDFSKQLKQFE
ncbi:MAG: ATP-binding cassette domain-containing protein [Chlamydiales bacterium]|nr:ATP-binding cassette domain-containing protein [Chlamydiales bacterium]